MFSQLDDTYFSIPLSDFSAGTVDNGIRNEFDCPQFNEQDNEQLCVATWHALLHLLCYKAETVITAVWGKEHVVLPLNSVVEGHTSFNDLYKSVNEQLVMPESSWINLKSSELAWIEDQVYCHSVHLLNAAPQNLRSEFELIHTKNGWKFDVSSALFSESYVKKISSLWLRLIRIFAAEPSQIISQQLLVDAAAVDYSHSLLTGPVIEFDGNLLTAFSKSVASLGEKIAVKDPLTALTYRELDDLSNHFAAILQRKGVKKGDCVGVAFDRTVKMIVAQLAILKSGAVFVPMDADQPDTRLSAIIDDAELAIVFTEKNYFSLLNEKIPQVGLIIYEELLTKQLINWSTEAHKMSKDDIAYVIFTSGSTGRPKGVRVSHGNLLNFVLHIEHHFDEFDRVTQFAPFTFDASVAEIHAALLNGSSLFILNKALIDNPELLQEYMTQERITFAAFPPQYAKHLAPEKLPTLKILLTAGSAPDRELIKRWQPHLQYINAYGPTETTVLSTAWQAKHMPEDDKPIAMGSPIVNTSVQIVNRFGNILPEGLIGELLIGGAGVAHGYLKQEELTAHRFIEIDQNRWYRSGDLSCIHNEDGLIFAGRVDDQIKLRGHRLEPGEVESAILSIVGIEAVAAVVTKINGENQLAIFCQGEQRDENKMRVEMQKVLPHWAIPNRVFWVSALPLTANGKIDYRKLKIQLTQFNEIADAGIIHYENELEIRVAEIWGSVLQQKHIARNDNFIHLGGDSLTALVVMSSLRRQGYSITSSQLLAHPVFSDFIALLQASDKKQLQDYSPWTGAAPISGIQGWFFNLNLASPEKFCQTLIVDCDIILDTQRLQRALTQLVNYHDQLRTTFKKDNSQLSNSEWIQEIAAAENTVNIKNFNIPQYLLEDETNRLREKLAETLDINAADSLFKFALINTESHSRIVWVLHHLLVDTISHGILLDDLYRLYTEDAPVQTVLPGKTIQYARWSELLLENVENSAELHLGAWQKTFDDALQADILPFDNNKNISSLNVQKIIFSAEETTLLLEQAPLCYHQSAEELVLAASYLALGKSFDAKNIGIDVEWHGRDENFAQPYGIDRSIGWFTSVHPLFISTASTHNLGEWLIHLKEKRAAIPERGRDFYTLRYLSKNERVRAAFTHYRQPKVLFNFSGVIQRSHTDWKTVPVVAIEMGSGNASPYALSIESEIRDGRLIVGLFLNEQDWPGALVEDFKNAFRNSLANIISHCVNPANKRWTPMDFPALQLTQQQIDELPVNTVSAYPLTDMQKTMWRNEDIYQVWMHYNFPRRFNERAFSNAVTSWIARHDCLRTVIKVWDDEKTAQVVLTDFTPRLTVHRTTDTQITPTAEKIIADARTRSVSVTRHPPHCIDVIDTDNESFSVVLSIHHIIHDGWSVELLLNDLFNRYKSEMGESVNESHPIISTMADVVAEQQRLTKDTYCNHYWSSISWAEHYSQLPQHGFSQTTQRDVQLYNGHIDTDLSNDVQQHAKKLGVTANSLLLTAYVLLLRYLGGAHQVRCGVIQNGRMENIPGVENITGCCVNTLPLCMDFEAQSSLSDIIKKVNAALTNMRDAAAFPLSKIHGFAKEQIEGEMFDTLFNIESKRYGGTAVVDAPALLGGYESTNYGFIFGVIETVSVKNNHQLQYDLRIGYDCNLYSRDAVIKWSTIYQHILTLLISGNEKSWSQVQPLPAHMQQQVVAWNNTQADYPHTACIGELFAQQVALHNHHPAIKFKDSMLTYAELDAQTHHLAVLLQKKGIGPDSIVGLVAERSPEMVIAILAIFKAGGAYVPIDPKYPADRVTHMVEDVGCDIIIFQHQKFSNVIPGSIQCDSIYMNQLNSENAFNDSSLDVKNHHSRQLAYVMYTSGSTGKPKGVMIEQRSIVRLVKNSKDISFAPEDTILLTSAPGFDVTTFEIWSALLNGLTLAIIDEETLLDPQMLASEIAQKNVSTLWLVAPLFNQLVQEKPAMFAGVKNLMIGGDALSPFHIRLVRKENPELQVINGYGPTENTSFSTYHFVSDNDADVIPIGLPITNSTTYVVNPDGHLLPPGINGELYVGGDGVARGYFKRPELTAEKFIKNPFVTDENALYRTGDLVRWREDGLIDFLGRIDFQVKIRGFRVELGEIESAILLQPDVKQVMVMAKTAGLQKQLVAYVVSAENIVRDEQKNVLIDAIKSALGAALPDYMVPAAFIVLDAMPLNANGKIDRNKLPEPDSAAYQHNRFVAPENAMESDLLEIWKEVLGVSNFGVTDSFYSIGGDSILSIQVVSRAAKKNIAITNRKMLENKTIRNIVKSVDVSSMVKSDGKNSVSQNLPSIGEQRLLPVQLKLIQDDTVDLHHYNQSAIIDLPQGTTADTLINALAAIIERHDVMRLRFRKTPSGWLANYQPLSSVQIIEHVNNSLEIHSLESSDNDISTLAEKYFNKAQASLDIKQGNTCRFVLLQENNQSSRLFWTMHHFVVDAVSWRTLLADLHALITDVDKSVNSASVLSNLPKPGSYQEWAGALYEYAYSEELVLEKNYWLKQLDSEPANFPFDHVEVTDNSEASTAVAIYTLDAEQTHQLLFQAGHYYDTRINELLLTALTQGIAQWSALEQVCIELEGHGRESFINDVNIDETVGWFTTIYPILFDSIEKDIGQQIQKIKNTLRAIPHNGIGFGLLTYIAQDEDILNVLEKSNSSAPILFNYLGQMDIKNDAELLSYTTDYCGDNVSRNRQRSHVLRINSFVKNGSLSFYIDFNSQQFTQKTIDTFGTLLLRKLSDIILHCVPADSSGVGPAVAPSAFPLAKLSKENLQVLLQKYPSLVDVYPATAMQEGLVLYTQREEGSGAYITQLSVVFENIDKEILRNSWQLIAQKYEILRTAFVDLNQDRLLQVVVTEQQFPWHEVDCRDYTQRDINTLIQSYRMAGFNTENPCLWNLMLLQRTDNQVELVWTHHHALLDGWSMAIVLQDLFAMYVAISTGKIPNVSILEGNKYRNYVSWLEQRNISEAESYWRKLLATVGAPSRIAQAVEKNTFEDQGQQQVSVQLESAISSELMHLAKNNNVTLSIIVQAAWALLLAKYTGDETVMFGNTFSGRPADLSGVENMVGLFINSLPAVFAINIQQTLTDFFNSIQQQQLDTEEHSYISLSTVQQWSNVSPTDSLFESVIVVENYPVDNKMLAGVAQAPGIISIPEIVSIKGIEQNNLPLNLVVYPGTEITLKLAYQSALFANEKIHAVLQHLTQLLRGFIGNHDKPLSYFSLLNAAEIQRATMDWNLTAFALPEEKGLYDLFSETASQYTKAPALIYGNEHLSYAELEGNVKQMSKWLAQKGVKSGDVVAVSMDKQPLLITALLGLLRLGAAYAPVAVDCPKHRREFIIADAGITFTLTDEKNASQLIEQSLSTELLLVNEALSLSIDVEIPAFKHQQAVAYIIYTSGTTGQPKGVKISHRNLINFCLWCKDAEIIKPLQACTQFAPYTFDASAGEIFATLLIGAQLHLLKDELIQEPNQVADYLVDNNIQFSAFPPPYLQQMPLERLPENLTLLTAGSAPGIELVNQLGKKVRYINAYGPTETTILSSAWFYNEADIARGQLPIGKPIHNTQVYVVDQFNQLCAPGMVGEIVIGGEGVALGYVNKPDINAAAFIISPWNISQRLYRTGDLGRWLSDGSVEFVGRRDNQIKIRGFRIEISEIENALLDLPEVKAAVVMAVGEGADKQLFAWIQPENVSPKFQQSEFISAVRTALKQFLPAYMIPQVFVVVEEFPLTANGKIDTKSLPQPDVDQVDGFTPAHSLLQQELVELWARVLKINVKKISITSNFFELGGHSLLAMRLANEIATALNIAVPVGKVFENPTISELANFIESKQHSYLPIIAVERKNNISISNASVSNMPMSFAQRRLWFIAQLDDASAAYHMPGGAMLDGKLNVDALQKSLDQIVARHEVLRTTFADIDGQPTQVIHAAAKFHLTIIDLQDSNPENLPDIVATYAEREANSSFDLTTGPLIRGSLLKISNEKHALLLSMHHIISDGWSMGLLLNELSALYRSHVDGVAPTLAELPVQYADYAQWQIDYLQGEVLERNIAFWRSALQGAPAVHNLPLDYVRPAEQSYRGAKYSIAIHSELTLGLKNLAANQQSTLFIVIYAAFSSLLSRYSNEADIVLGTPIANREQSDVANLIGFFANTLLLRLDLSEDKRFVDILKQAKKVAMGAYEHQQLPFDVLVEELQPERSLSYNPLFQVMLSLINAEMIDEITLADVAVTELQDTYQTTAQFDLMVDILDDGKQLTFSWIYATDLFKLSTIERMANSFVYLLESIVKNPHATFSELKLLSDKDIQMLVQDLNKTDKPELLSESWPHIFDRQIAANATKVVARCAGFSLTYQQLADESGKVARALNARGIARDSVVALLDYRGIDLLVMITGVLRAGAAYLPLDPSHPTQRWLDILIEGQPNLLIVGDDLSVEQRWLSRRWKKENIIASTELKQHSDQLQNEFVYPGLNDLAYVIYTSGSTGRPKGVMIEHRGMINNMLSKYQPFGLQPSDVIAQTASQCFDISVWQFLIAPILGATVVIFPDDITRDSEMLLHQLAYEKVTIWEPVPSVMQAALPLAIELPDVRWVLPTGEALTASLVTRWFEQYPHIPLMNAYGPAECSDDVCFHPIYSATERVLIGSPVANARLHIVDKNLALVPIGVTGELAVSGAVVGRGYLHAPDLTQAVFKQNPFSQNTNDERLYLTGDLARRLDDGTLEYVGRKDFQVKIRGFRIELGEIESRLNAYAGVSDAIVTVRESPSAEKILVAYIQLQKNHEAVLVNSEILRAHLKADLPDYMIPTAFVLMEQFPLNANGKVDRKSLPLPDFNRQPKIFVAPETETEQKLAQVWSDILKVENVGREDDFFDLGGNSLLIMRVINAARKEGIELTLNDVYQGRTIKNCSAVIALPAAKSWRESLTERNIAFAVERIKQASGDAIVLVISSNHSLQDNELKKIIGTSSDEMPDYIFVVDDIHHFAKKVSANGMAFLSNIHPVDGRKISESCISQSQLFEKQYVGSPVIEDYRLTPAQKDMLQWDDRQVVNTLTVRGYYSGEELQAAFANVQAEHDLLRSTLSKDVKVWELRDIKRESVVIPAMDVKYLIRDKQKKLCEGIVEALSKLQRKSQLPYAATWFSLSDTEHMLVIIADHMICDASAFGALKQQVINALQGNVVKVQRTYRQYVDDVYHGINDAGCKEVEAFLNVLSLKNIQALTDSAIGRRQKSTLREIRLRAVNTLNPAETAFDIFKSVVSNLLSLSEYAMVLNHHGRNLQGHSDFDQFGLFLDKVPSIVSATTTLHGINTILDSISKAGMNITGFSQSDFTAVTNILPALNKEVLFNYIGEETENVASENLAANTLHKLKQFYGVLFEAFTVKEELFMRVIFRGDTTDERKVEELTAGKAVLIDKSLSSAQQLATSDIHQHRYAIEVRDVKKRYGEFEAVKGVSFNVEKGKCFGILGPNGAGKTSLLGMMEGLTPISSGSIQLMGMDVATHIRKIQPHLGVQLQHSNYFDFLTVKQLLKFYQEFRGANSRKVSGHSIDELLERLFLSDKKESKVEELSGGQKQRLSMVIALLEDPEILFLDEPTSALDPHNRRYTWEFIEELKKDGNKTIILTTHYMEEAERLCDELLIMNGGLVISQGTPAQLVNNINNYHEISVEFARGASKPEFTAISSHLISSEWDSADAVLNLKTRHLNETLKDLSAYSEAKGVQIIQFNIKRPNLEDVFLSSTGKELKE